MRLKELEGYLQDVAVFDNPKIKLEQYPTTPHLASRILFTAHSTYDDIEGRIVADFGCGCGILSIASCLLGATHVIAVDIDPDALEIAQKNISDFELENTVDLMHFDLTAFPDVNNKPILSGKVDTVVMNPPFGTKNWGIDMAFLKQAVSIAERAVYSLHKTSTREYIMKKSAEWNMECEVLAEMKFDVPMMYKFHKKRSKRDSKLMRNGRNIICLNILIFPASTLFFPSLPSDLRRKISRDHGESRIQMSVDIKLCEFKRRLGIRAVIMQLSSLGL
ncbi:uncharacterized protein VTP21DRAFT_7164 [Calcarisporiella thermophila]|uniref:uncharacterized protein n=1 Tax=Calcarisporiella thermophila TaxID=911321 RepID=UPI003744331D